MVIFLEHIEQISEFISDINNSNFPIAIPIWQYLNKHIQQNVISFWYFRTDTNEYILGECHPDILLLNTITIFNSIKQLFTPRKKELPDLNKLGIDLIDISGIELFKYNIITDISEYFNGWQKNNIVDNNIVPIMKWAEILSSYSKELQNRLIESYNIIKDDKGFQFLNNITIPLLKKIEAPGLTIDKIEFKKHYYETENERVYSSYNPYTMTGRPSNKFNRINFAAIPKTTGARKAFVKDHKYDDAGALVLMDFESFHLRLIAKQMGMKLDFDIPVHEQLARQYFMTFHVTPEQYKLSKERTFSALYNHHRQKSPIEFFQQVYMFIDSLWEIGKKQGYVETPEGRKIYLDKIVDNSDAKIKAKLFNYYVQALETEESMRAIERFFSVNFENIEVIPILYTYDSFLFQVSDVYPSYHILGKMQKILENNEFPVRIFYGYSYQ